MTMLIFKRSYDHFTILSYDSYEHKFEIITLSNFGLR